MKKFVYWKLSNGKKVKNSVIENDIKNSLSVIEIKMLYLIRNSEVGTLSRFYNLAEKTFDANQTKIAFENSIENDKTRR